MFHRKKTRTFCEDTVFNKWKRRFENLRPNPLLRRVSNISDTSFENDWHGNPTERNAGSKQICLETEPAFFSHEMHFLGNPQFIESLYF